MTTLLSFRNGIKNFFSRYDYIVTPIGKGIFALIVFLVLNSRMGYFAALDNIVLLLGLAVVCAFLPIEILTGIGGVMIVLHSVKVSLDVAFVALVLALVFYCGYMRMAPKTGIITLIVPMCYVFNVTYALPIVLGFLVGPAAIVPAIFGVLLYYYQEGLVDVSNVLATVTEDTETVQGYQYIIDLLVNNKFMLLTFVVFACVILVTYIIYRMSFVNSWIVSFIVGGILNLVLFLVGSVTLSLDVKLSSVLIGSFVGVLMAFVIQFCKGMVDYQQTEILQFEDDDYYYYVKAIPKLSVAESNKNVKHINSKTHN